MLLYSAIALFALAVICIILYVLMTKKIIRVDKRVIDIKILRKITGIASAVLVIAAGVLTVIYIRSNLALFEKLEKYDPVKEYGSQLKAKGKDRAYEYLPDGVFTFNGEIYFKNGKNDLFMIKSKTELDSEGKETVKYSAVTVANGVRYVGGERTLKATINDDDELILDGYLLYTEFDGDRIEYDNEVIAQDVKYCTLTDNSVLYIKNNGKMYGIGFNEYAHLGDKTAKNKKTPTFIAKDVSLCSISETHSMTVDKFGTLRAVGDNSYSQLGNKTAISTQQPITIMQGAMDVKVGNFYSVVLAINGEVYTAGSNEKGQLGNSGEAFKAELVSILGGVTKIDANGDTCAALNYKGELFVWGDNEGTKAGVVGDVTVPTPTKAAEGVHDFVLTKDGVVIITNERDIYISTVAGSFTEALAFNASIPEMYKPETEIIEDGQADAA